MKPEYFSVVIDGREAVDLYDSVLSLEVELDDELAAMFTLQLAMTQRPDGSWTIVDDERLVAWRSVRISAGFDRRFEDLIDAVITHVRPHFASEPDQCRVEVWGMDRSALLDRVEVRRAWPGQRDSDIAREIFHQHGLTPQVDDTPIGGDDLTPTIIQRETDIQFLTRRAIRHNFECYVEGRTGYFRAPRIDETPQPVLGAYFGGGTTLRRFSVEVNATTPAEIVMTQLSPVSKDIVDVAATQTSQTVFGATGSDALLPADLPSARIILAGAMASGAAEHATLCRSARDRVDWFVRGEGEVVANLYGHVLRARRPVTVKGVGATHSGVYQVSHVAHVFDGDGYVQRFQVRRNGLRPRGDERFADQPDLLGGFV